MKINSRLSRSLGISLQAVHKLHYEFSDAQKCMSASSGLSAYHKLGIDTSRRLHGPDGRPICKFF